MVRAVHVRLPLIALTCALTACTALPGRDVAAPIAIGAVQGPGLASPLIGRTVVVAGVVTLRLHGDGVHTGGVFVQDAGDGDAATSDAVFVQGTGVDALAVGSAVRVHGRVLELDTGRGSRVTAIDASRGEPIQARSLPAALAAARWSGTREPIEGMRIAFDALHLDAHADLAEAGTVLASVGDAPWQVSERARPRSADAVALQAAQDARRVRLDDARLGVPDTTPVWWSPLAAARSGSVLRGVTGVVDHRDGAYAVHLDAVAAIDAAPRPQAPRIAGRLRIAALNVENLFNGDGAGGGFPTERGARTQAEFDVQLSKQVATITALAPDVVALMEVENDGHGPRSAEGQLVAALNAAGGAWRGVELAAPIGSDQIRVGLLYRSDRLRPVGRPATLTGGPFDGRSRVPLAQAFVIATSPGSRGRTNDAFVVVANHFKSKGCGNAQGLDADQRDGQSCFNAARVDSAQRLHRWITTDPTRSGATRIALLGDFNAYAREDPMHWLREAGWRDAFEVAGVESPYSYVYQGLRGRLDHAMLSEAFARDLRGAAEWHVNADEPESQGYRASPQGAATPWRGSDHDPMVLGFDINGRAP